MSDKKTYFFRFSASLFAFLLSIALFSCVSGSSNEKQKENQNGQAENAKIEQSQTSEDIDQKPAGAFFVDSVSPQGEIPRELKYPAIQIHFSKPVVAISKLKEPSSKNTFVTIEPELKGNFRWLGSDLLSFECGEKIIPQQLYSVKVSPELKSIDGEAISGCLEYSFHTPPVRLLRIEAGWSGGKRIFNSNKGIPPEYVGSIKLKFSDPVDPETISRGISIVDSEKDSYEWTFSKSEPDELMVNIGKTLPRNRTFYVKLQKGVRSFPAALPVQKEQSFEFSTVKSFILRESGFSDGLFHLDFENPVASSQEGVILDSISFSPEISLSSENIKIDGRRVTIESPSFDFGKSYKWKISGGKIKDVYGQSLENGENGKFSCPDAASFVEFDWQGGDFSILESSFKPKVAFSYQNLVNAKKNTGNFYEVTPISGVSPSFKPGKSERVTVDIKESEKNKRIVRTVDLSPYLEKIGGNFRGAVLFKSELSSKDGGGSIEKIIQVTDLALSARISDGKAALMLTRISDGSPVPDAEISACVLESQPDKEVKSADYRNRIQANIIRALKNEGKSFAGGKTDSDGFCLLDLEKIWSHSSVYFDVRTKENDDRLVYCQYLYQAFGSRPERYSGTKRPAVFIFSDRNIYKPGEHILVKAIDRTLTDGEYSPYSGGWEMRLTSASYGAFGKNAKVFASAKASSSENGGAWADFKIPEDIKLGRYYINYRRDGDNPDNALESIPVNIQFFEKATFQVSAKIPDGIYYAGDEIPALVEGKYLGGGPLADSSVHADWTCRPHDFAPQTKELSEFTFGPERRYEPYFIEDENGEIEDDGKLSPQYFSDEAKLDSLGRAELSIKSPKNGRAGEASLWSLEAQVTDSGNKLIAARTSVPVHPASFYIGLKREGSYFASAGKKVSFKYTAVTPDLKAVEQSLFGRTSEQVCLSCKISRQTWEKVTSRDSYGYEKSEYVKKNVVEKEDSLSLPADGKILTFDFTPKTVGLYTLTLSGLDFKGRKAVSQLSFWVSSDDYSGADFGNQGNIELDFDKKLYKGGETASLLVRSPLASGKYLMTLEREEIILSRVIEAKSPIFTVEIPVSSDWLPEVSVNLSALAGRTEAPPMKFDGNDNGRPREISGHAKLNVSLEKAAFDIEILPAKDLFKPGEEAQITLKARKNGSPLKNAEVTLIVVDKGVTMLTDSAVKNPLDYFYASEKFWPRVDGSSSLDNLSKPAPYDSYSEKARYESRRFFRLYKSAAVYNDIAEEASLPMAADSIEGSADFAAMESKALGSSAQNAVVRSDFRNVAYYSPAIITDSNGEALVKFHLPDSITEYQVIAVGVKENLFAKNEASIKAANPISARTLLPSILRPGDKGEVGVLLTNISSSDESLSVTAEIYSGLSKTGYVAESGDKIRQSGEGEIVSSKKIKSLLVEAGKSQSVLFDLKALSPGWITVAFHVESGSLNEIIYEALEIEKPYVYETVTTVGQLDFDQDLEREKVILPQSEDSNGSLTVTLDSTRLGTLSEAVGYLFHYPYGCMEQRSAAVLPLISFGKYISLFGLNSEVREPEKVCQKEIESWAFVQKKDGGFPYWPDGRESSLFVSMRIAEICAIAKENGISTGKINLEKLSEYIKKELQTLEKKSSLGDYCASYGNYVLSLGGQKIFKSQLDKILEENSSSVSALSLASLAYLKSGDKASAQKALLKVKNAVTLTNRGADIAGRTSYWGCFGGKNDDLSLALQAFASLNPSDSYVGHLVYELLERQKASKGYWTSTASTARALIAINSYIKAERLEGASFTAACLLDGKELSRASFTSLSDKAASEKKDFSREPLSSLEKGKELPLEVKKWGSGNLFYTVSLKYALPVNEQKARDQGFSLKSQIMDARSGSLVEENSLEAGKIYKMKVELSSPRNRSFVALRLPVPAGCEILNPDFKTTATIPQVKDKESGETLRYTSLFYRNLSHQEIYPAEVRYFWDNLPQGSQTIEFFFRAVRNGEFSLPPAQAECMYEEEIFGRTDGSVWRID